MSRILFIEDDENKMKQVTEFLLNQYPDMDVDRAGSVQSGTRKILSEHYDLYPAHSGLRGCRQTLC